MRIQHFLFGEKKKIGRGKEQQQNEIGKNKNPLFIDKKFMLEEMTQRNISNFAIFFEQDKIVCMQVSSFFSLHDYLFIHALALFHRPGHKKTRKNKVAENKIRCMYEKNWIFVIQKYGKLLSLLIGHFIKHQLLMSEE